LQEVACLSQKILAEKGRVPKSTIFSPKCVPVLKSSVIRKTL